MQQATLLRDLAVDYAHKLHSHVEQMSPEEKKKTALIAAGSSAILGSAYYLYKAFRRYQRRRQPLPDLKAHGQYYDVIIAGAGPAGATCAYYLAKAGVRVLLLEKKKFPRDKYCGDAVTHLAQVHMERMGVLQEIVAEGKGHWSDAGGFVSPSGNAFIGCSAKTTENMGKGKVIAIKRIDMDEKIARAAQKAGANLLEENTVESASFDKAAGLWTVMCGDANNSTVAYKGRVLVCADGAPSNLARKLGLVKTEPEGVCSRAFIEPGTHNFNADGVVFYDYQLLPGYCSLFKHARDELGFCCYIIPGGPAKNEDLPKMHQYLLKSHPSISKAVGPNAKIESMKAGSLRLGGIANSYGDNILVIGDAAGHIDPLTGEGIQYAMDGAQYAAEELIGALGENDLSAERLHSYHSRWMKAFGTEFFWSMRMSMLLYRFPIMLDATAEVIKKKGPEFLAEWALVMTGGKTKLWFIRPDVLLPVFIELTRLVFARLFNKKLDSKQPVFVKNN